MATTVEIALQAAIFYWEKPGAGGGGGKNYDANQYNCCVFQIHGITR
jgi:hypothetical protein